MDSQGDGASGVDHWQRTDHVNILMKEYERLKDEQARRIGFRDGQIFVTLGAIGGLASYATVHKDDRVFLLIPWVCVIMGWNYLVNDEKISAIGRYIRRDLAG